MKLILVGLWVVLVALGSAFGMAMFMPPPGAASAKAEPPPVLQSLKTRIVSVPMIADGAPQGFVTMQFNYTVNAEMAKTVTVPADVYLIDDAFRMIYSDPSLEFKHLEKFDVNKFTAHLLQDVNEKLGVPLVKEVLIDNFAFVPKDTKE